MADDAKTLRLPGGQVAPPDFPFRLQAVLGEGGFGVVYRAAERSSGRTVALKVMRPEVAATPEFVRRFLREIGAMRRLRHPGIVAVLDAGEVAGTPWVAMELVDGVTLRALLASRGRLDVREALWVCVALLDALGHVHDHGLVHRDLKPENVMVSPDGRVKLLDFGIVLAQERTKLTGTGIILGTPAYLAPEAFEGAGELTGRADLFAWGLVTCEALAGPRSDLGGSLVAVLDDVRSGAPVARVRRACPQLPPEFESCLTSCLRRDPAERPSRAAEVRRGLEPLLQRLPPVAPRLGATAAPVPPGPSRPPWRPRAPLALVAAATFTLALLAAVGVTRYPSASPDSVSSSDAPAGAAPATLLEGPFVRSGPGFVTVRMRLAAAAEVTVVCTSVASGRTASERRSVSGTAEPEVTLRFDAPREMMGASEGRSARLAVWSRGRCLATASLPIDPVCLWPERDVDGDVFEVRPSLAAAGGALFWATKPGDLFRHARPTEDDLGPGSADAASPVSVPLDEGNSRPPWSGVPKEGAALLLPLGHRVVGVTAGPLVEVIVLDATAPAPGELRRLTLVNQRGCSAVGLPARLSPEALAVTILEYQRGHTVCAVDVASARIRRSSPFSGDDSPSLLAVDGRPFLWGWRGDRGFVRGLDPESLEPVWQFDCGPVQYPPVAESGRGALFVADAAGIYRLPLRPRPGAPKRFDDPRAAGGLVLARMPQDVRPASSPCLHRGLVRLLVSRGLPTRLNLVQRSLLLLSVGPEAAEGAPDLALIPGPSVRDRTGTSELVGPWHHDLLVIWEQVLLHNDTYLAALPVPRAGARDAPLAPRWVVRLEGKLEGSPVLVDGAVFAVTPRGVWRVGLPPPAR